MQKEEVVVSRSRNVAILIRWKYKKKQEIKIAMRSFQLKMT